MKAHLHYASYVVRHKWFVFYAGLKIKAPLWRLVIHDWSKLTPAEWFPYVLRFYGHEGTADAFNRARMEVEIILGYAKSHSYMATA